MYTSMDTDQTQKIQPKKDCIFAINQTKKNAMEMTLNLSKPKEISSKKKYAVMETTSSWAQAIKEVGGAKTVIISSKAKPTHSDYITRKTKTPGYQRPQYLSAILLPLLISTQIMTTSILAQLL